MKKHWVIFIIGIIIALLPFLGFPYTADRWMTTIGGIIIAYLSFTTIQGATRHKHAYHEEEMEN